VATVQACSYSSSSDPDLKEAFKKVLPAKRELLKKVKAVGDKKLGDVKVENALGGMRYAHAYYDTDSFPDKLEGG
jgi:citrate synthase